MERAVCAGALWWRDGSKILSIFWSTLVHSAVTLLCLFLAVCNALLQGSPNFSTWGPHDFALQAVGQITQILNGSWGSSVSIVSDYGLDYRAFEVRFRAEAKDFSSNLCVQTGSGTHPASCTMGTGGPFPGGKARPGRDADHSSHLVPKSWMSRSNTSSLPCVFMACGATTEVYLNKLLMRLLKISCQTCGYINRRL
jgi:hypothetical protein